MNQSLTQNHENKTRRIAFIQACWHKDIVDRIRVSFVAEIERRGVSGNRIDVFEVPGSLEIPLQSNLLAKSGRYAAIVAAGLIVDGGIYRHEFVAEAVIAAILRVQLDTEVPIVSVVLTPHNFHEHAVHEEFFARHFEVKGVEAAAACVQTLENLARIARIGKAA